MLQLGANIHKIFFSSKSFCLKFPQILKILPVQVLKNCTARAQKRLDFWIKPATVSPDFWIELAIVCPDFWIKLTIVCLDFWIKVVSLH